MKLSLPNLRKVSSGWGEIEKQYSQVLSFFYEKNDHKGALRLAPRLRLLIALHDPQCNTILGAAARSVLAELDGDYWTAIRAREREIELLKQLHGEGLPAEIAASPEDISDRLDLLAGLYWESGDLEKAEKTLLNSQHWCAQKGIKFDGKSMLQELRKEKRVLARRNATPKKRAS